MVKRRIAYSGIIGALAIGLGFALAAVPNVELLTLTVGVGGFILGPVWGGLTGMLSWVIYSLLNPMGAPPPHYLVVQALAGLLAGLFGSLLAVLYRRWKANLPRVLAAATVGLLTTFIYQVGINVASFMLYGSEETLIPFIIAGIAFSGLHLVSNTLIFGAVFPLIARIWERKV